MENELNKHRLFQVAVLFALLPLFTVAVIGEWFLKHTIKKKRGN